MKRQTIYVGVFLSFFVAAALLGENEPQKSNQNGVDQGEYPDDTDPREFFESLKLDTICPNEDLTPPVVIVDLPAYHNDSTSIIRWIPVPDDPAVKRYLAVASVDRTFKSELTSFKEIDVFNEDTVSTPLTLSVEDTVWYRVYSRDAAGCISHESNTINTIQDMMGPRITHFVIKDWRTDDTEGTSERRVRVKFCGDDSTGIGCDHIDLSEDATFSRDVTTDTLKYSMECCDSVDDFYLSPNQEKKILYGRMTDKLGNVGEIASCSTFYARKLYNYPNPFIPSRHTRTNIVYWLSKPCNGAYINIYDSFGNHVCRIPGSGNEGFNTVTWDGHNTNGDLVANGGYLCVLKGDKKYTHKIAVLK